MIRTRQLVGAACVAIAALTAGCGGGGVSGGGPTGTPGGSTSNAITVANNSFTPSSTTVPVGTTVTWTWATGAVGHNVTFSTGTSSPTQSAGTFARTFGAAGTFGYVCTVHGSAMSGTIIVQ